MKSKFVKRLQKIRTERLKRDADVLVGESRVYMNGTFIGTSKFVAINREKDDESHHHFITSDINERSMKCFLTGVK